ncbi:MAG: carboxypeptidase-like regulatory domain-containing protein [Spirochaetaceae bacterium]
MSKKIIILILSTFLLMTSCDSLLELIEGDDGGGDDYYEEIGYASGTVYDAVTGEGISGVTISDYEMTSYSTTSDWDGSFYIELPPGYRTLDFSSYNHDFVSIEVEITEYNTTYISDNEIIGNPYLGYGEYRIVLTWGDNPTDLDANILFTAGGSSTLNRSDSYQYGPETITLNGLAGITYKYYVYNYSQDENFPYSDALVTVYDQYGFVESFTPPNYGDYTNIYWYVFDLNNGNINYQNMLQTLAPTI